jgi:hypothetical protein
MDKIDELKRRLQRIAWEQAPKILEVILKQWNKHLIACGRCQESYNFYCL